MLKKNDNRKLIYIHIPKTAGTSIEDLGKKYDINWGRFAVKNDKYLVSNNIKCSKWHNPYFIYSKNTFTVVRNPYDRIISEFYWERLNGLHTYETNISGFEKWILDVLDNDVKNDNIYLNDCHILPQTEYTHNKDDTQRIEHIIKYDNITNELKNLFNEYELKIDINELPFNNKSKKTFTINDISNEIKLKIYNYYKRDFNLLGFNNN